MNKFKLGDRVRVRETGETGVITALFGDLVHYTSAKEGYVCYFDSEVKIDVPIKKETIAEGGYGLFQFNALEVIQ